MLMLLMLTTVDQSMLGIPNLHTVESTQHCMCYDVMCTSTCIEQCLDSPVFEVQRTQRPQEERASRQQRKGKCGDDPGAEPQSQYQVSHHSLRDVKRQRLRTWEGALQRLT